MTHETTISGYTWGFNAVKKLLPYEACIKSMLLLADEVYVVYDPRYDLPENFTRIDERVIAVPQEINITDIKREGQMLSKSRALCKGKWLIWLDLDEVLHEKDVDDILQLIQYAENGGYTSLDIGFYCYVSKQYTFSNVDFWGIRHKIMKNIEGVSHGLDQDFLQQRDDGTCYLSGGDGIDFIKDGKLYGFRPLTYKDLPLYHKLKERTANCEDIIKSVEYFPYIYHYARYSMQRKIKMLEDARFSFWQNQHGDFNPSQWIDDLASPVIMEQVKETEPIGFLGADGFLGKVEPAHPAVMKEWTELMDRFMVAENGT
ncbi:MAG: hypothetical protein ACYS1A_08355 [Planctomycetota bacterium]|jgi:hypothetical protein